MSDNECQDFQERRIKIEEEVKEEQDDCNDVDGEETALGLPNEQSKIYGYESPTNEQGDSDEEELKPPVAVWVKEEPKEYVEEDEDPLVLDNEVGEGNGSFSEAEKGNLEGQWVAPQPAESTTGWREDSDAGPSSPAACREPPTLNMAPNVCPVCGKEFPEKQHLVQHMLWHTREEQYQCSICKKRFSQIWDLGVHERLHTEKKPHECSQCGKKFSQKWGLGKHMVTHTKDRETYECSLCKKKYSEKGTLQRHMLAHTGGEKLFRCSVCMKTFHQKRHLALHERSHTKHVALVDDALEGKDFSQ